MNMYTFAAGTLTSLGTATLTAFTDPVQARVMLFNAGTVTRTVGLYVQPSGGAVQQFAGVILLAGEAASWPSALSRWDFGAGDKIIWSLDGAGVVNALVGGLK